jgi:hypothetical protein
MKDGSQSVASSLQTSVQSQFFAGPARSPILVPVSPAVMPTPRDTKQGATFIAGVEAASEYLLMLFAA